MTSLGRSAYPGLRQLGPAPLQTWITTFGAGTALVSQLSFVVAAFHVQLGGLVPDDNTTLLSTTFLTFANESGCVSRLPDALNSRIIEIASCLPFFFVAACTYS